MFSALTDYENRFKSIELKVNNITQILLRLARDLEEIKTNVRAVRINFQTLDEVRKKIAGLTLEWEDNDEKMQMAEN